MEKLSKKAYEFLMLTIHYKAFPNQNRGIINELVSKGYLVKNQAGQYQCDYAKLGAYIKHSKPKTIEDEIKAIMDKYETEKKEVKKDGTQTYKAIIADETCAGRLWMLYEKIKGRKTTLGLAMIAAGPDYYNSGPREIIHNIRHSEEYKKECPKNAPVGALPVYKI